jgi:hypothetical protein
MVTEVTLLIIVMHTIDCIAIHSVDDDIPTFCFDVEVDYIIVVRHHAIVPTTVLIQSSAAGHCSTNDPGINKYVFMRQP